MTYTSSNQSGPAVGADQVRTQPPPPTPAAQVQPPPPTPGSVPLRFPVIPAPQAKASGFQTLLMGAIAICLGGSVIALTMSWIRTASFFSAADQGPPPGVTMISLAMIGLAAWGLWTSYQGNKWGPSLTMVGTGVNCIVTLLFIAAAAEKIEANLGTMALGAGPLVMLLASGLGGLAAFVLLVAKLAAPAQR
jgi:hypothetical protein